MVVVAAKVCPEPALTVLSWKSSTIKRISTTVKYIRIPINGRIDVGNNPKINKNRLNFKIEDHIWDKRSNI